MENSFFEFRDKTNVKPTTPDATANYSDLDDAIDNSYMEESFTVLKTPSTKNQTVAYVAESDEFSAEEDSRELPKVSVSRGSNSLGHYSGVNIDKDTAKRLTNRRHNNLSRDKMLLSSSSDEEDSKELPQVSISRQSNALAHYSGSDEDIANRLSDRRHSNVSCNNVQLSSSSDEGLSPEIVPNWRNRVKPNVNNDSIIGYKSKKRLVLHDSDSESHDELKDDYMKKNDSSTNKNNDSTNKNDDSINKNGYSMSKNDDSTNKNDHDQDEDQLLMCAATRMSIMGIRPKDMDSDESDFIQSDESHMTKSSAHSSLEDLPDVSACITGSTLTPKKTLPTDHALYTLPPQNYVDIDASMISCSSIGSPINESINESSRRVVEDKNVTTSMEMDHTENKVNVSGGILKEINVGDDDIILMDSTPMVIAISSSDEDEPKTSLKARKSVEYKTTFKDIKINTPKTQKTKEDGKNVMKQYLVPASYPNQFVVYVKKSVRDSELNKLETLREDLHNVRYLIENMDVDTLPDGGVKLMERLSKLENDVKEQGEKVASMVVEPEKPTMADLAKDGFGDKKEGLSWEAIQAASNNVQPRMFGKQAMATHMAERNHILDRLRDLHSSLASRPPETKLAAQPSALKTKLMPYQQHALEWLQWRETQRPRGGILADDMGLGKTITMIALMIISKDQHLDENDENDRSWHGRDNAKMAKGGTLVVCPASLLQQWAGEVTKHCASHALSVCLHHGAARATHPQRLAGHDMVVTTYNLLQRDLEKRGVLMKIRWHRIILDEAHIVRNHKSNTSMAVSALEGEHRWCLTGTPVQNKDLDVFALLKFLRCTPFDDLVMWKKWIDNKSMGGQERLSTIMGSLLLRRTKQQLQQKGQLDCLPERDQHYIEVTLTKDEMNVYQKVLVFSKTLFAQFLHQRAEKQAEMDGFLTKKSQEDAYSKMHKRMVALHGAKPVKSHEILVLLLRLRQVCCHCGLIAAMLDAGEDPDVVEDAGSIDLLSELQKLSLEDASRGNRLSIANAADEEPGDEPEGTTAAEAIRSVLSTSNPVFSYDNISSKIRAVVDCLKENVFSKNGEKAVVVSQWTSVLRLVQMELEKMKITYTTLSGQVPVPARPAVVDAFNNPRSQVQVILLSLCAGGVGLNLCGGNHLLLLDPHWNPQLEQQAQDRIYRVGQKRHVHVYRFICLDTVEQTIKKLQEAKLELAENVLTGARHTNASKLTIEDLKMLFNMGSN